MHEAESFLQTAMSAFRRLHGPKSRALASGKSIVFRLFVCESFLRTCYSAHRFGSRPFGSRSNQGCRVSTYAGWRNFGFGSARQKKSLFRRVYVFPYIHIFIYLFNGGSSADKRTLGLLRMKEKYYSEAARQLRASLTVYSGLFKEDHPMISIGLKKNK